MQVLNWHWSQKKQRSDKTWTLSRNQRGKKVYETEQKGILPGSGKLKPAGSRGTITAGWFCTRAKKFSDGSGNTISLYDSITTGFLVDWGPDSSSGYNFKWWYLWIIKHQKLVNYLLKWINKKHMKQLTNPLVYRRRHYGKKGWWQFQIHPIRILITQMGAIQPLL